MIQENTDRNILVYELWIKGRTIDEIASETAIPRSTVGYYVRKFNKRAKNGEPIVLQKREPPDEKKMAINAYFKKSTYSIFLEMFKNREIDKAYKMLMIYKLWKELRGDFFLTKEENEAFYKNLF